MAAHRMTPARKAALKKAQAASARKRRGKGKGKLAAANRKIGSGGVRGHLRRNAAGYAAIGVAGAYLAASVHGIRKRNKANRKAADYHAARSKASYENIRKMTSASNKRSNFHRKTRPQAHSGRATKHNRVFVTSRHGTTSVRKRY